jgi:hypothetical protein
MKLRAILALVLGAAVTQGCMGRGSAVTAANVSGGGMKGEALTDIYLVPFDTSTVKVEGDHGEGAKKAENIANWATHVAIGLQKHLPAAKVYIVRPALTDHDRTAMEKSKVTFRSAAEAPAGALVVTGTYLTSKNVSGAARAWLGVMSGKSVTTAKVAIQKGGAGIFDGELAGKYLGGGFSWGYEMLGVNEGLGDGIGKVIESLQRGETPR